MLESSAWARLIKFWFLYRDLGYEVLDVWIDPVDFRLILAKTTEDMEAWYLPGAFPAETSFSKSMRPSILPLFLIVFVKARVSTPYMAGMPSSLSHVPSDDVAR